MRQQVRRLGVCAMRDLPRVGGLCALSRVWVAGQESVPHMSQATLRQPRNRRRKGVNVELTERDETVLHALGRFRIARTSDLVRYAFAGVRADTAAVRLRRLFDSAHLAVLPPQRGAENVYRLGPTGRRYLAERGAEVSRLPRGGLRHHLAIVHAWVSVAAIAEFELERCVPDWELREQFAVGEICVLPDLLMLVRQGPALHAVAVEVDCGTESQGVLNRKIEAYRMLWAQPPGLFGYQRFGVAAACYAPSRRAAVSSALKKAWVVPNVLWLASESPKSALLKLFAELATPLESSPSRKGTLPCPSEA